MSISSVNSLSQLLLQSSFDASTSDHYLALLAQRIMALEQKVARTAVGSNRATGKIEQTAMYWLLGKPTDFIPAETYLTTPQPMDELAQQLLQQFLLQSADSTVVQAYVAQLRQYLDGLEQQFQPLLKYSQMDRSLTFVAQDLPSYAVLCGLLPACFTGFWTGVSPCELSEHSQQTRSPNDAMINVYPPTPEQRAEAKALLQSFTPAQHSAFSGLCQTLQRVYRLTWQRDFKPIVLGTIV